MSERTPTAEPAAYAEAARLVIGALVGLGWLTVDNNTVNVIASAIGAVLSVAFTIMVRMHVTPTGSDTNENSPAGNPGGAVSDE